MGAAIRLLRDGIIEEGKGSKFGDHPLTWELERELEREFPSIS